MKLVKNVFEMSGSFQILLLICTQPAARDFLVTSNVIKFKLKIKEEQPHSCRGNITAKDEIN